MAITNPGTPVAIATDKLVQFFFESLPHFFKDNDTYVDVSDEGLLERFLKIFQTESEQYVTDLENMETLQASATTQLQFLDYIAEYMGSPPDTFEDTDWYSVLLENIAIINRNRGTTESLQNFFKIMGTTCTVTATLSTYYTHDSGETHDDTDVHHDGYCYPCVGIEIDVLDPTFIITQLNITTLTQSTRRIIQSILVYFLPINSLLEHFKYNGVTKVITLTSGDIVPPVTVEVPIPIS